MKLNLGCGSNLENTNNGWINIDKYPLYGSVVKMDLEQAKLPYEDDSVEEIRATHVLEHIWNYKELLNECWRVLNKDGFIYIEVPKFPHPDSVKDPDHKRFFVEETFTGYFSNYPIANQFLQYQIKPWDVKEIYSEDSFIRVIMVPHK